MGLINALSSHKNISLDKERLAQSACNLEIKLCGSPIGKQDQYAAAYGGLKIYKFNCDDTVTVEDVLIKPEIKNQLDQETIAFYIGGTRMLMVILAAQQKVKRKRKDQHYEENG